MSYKEDIDLPLWVTKSSENEDELAFLKWYEYTFRCNVSPRSPRFYQMRRAWMASKNYYLKEQRVK